MWDDYEPVMRDVYCEWIWGPTRTGKSWLAISSMGVDPKSNLKEIFFKNSQNKWWDGYTGQKKVIIDELDKIKATHWMTFLKKWCDKLPCALEVKGGTVPALYTTLFITC